MKLSLQHVLVMLGSLMATFGLLWGGAVLWQRSAVAKPLVAAVDAVPGVRASTIQASGSLRVTLRSNASLIAVYRAVAPKASAKGTPFVIASSATPALNAVGQQARLIIAQGIATGRYVTMNQALEALARRHHMTAVVALGNRHLYFTLRQGAKRLDQVVPLGEGGVGRA